MMNDLALSETISQLHDYCSDRDYKGHDVADSVDCWLMTHTSIGKNNLIRFGFLQLTGHRLGYINMRPLMRIPTYHNGKGIALFLNAYCNLYEVACTDEQKAPLSKAVCLEKINYLGHLLLTLRHKADKGAGWGYPTTWQARNFQFPANTPTAVASSFAVDALLHAYTLTKEDAFKNAALETATFVLQDLHRTPYKEGFMFSYSQYSGNDTVYNASLLAARILLQCYQYEHNEEYLNLAQTAIETCVRDQAADGSWKYGLLPVQTWIDNFHTGYNLEAIWEYKHITGSDRYDDCLKRGADFMLQHHFDANGVPKYYHNKQYPIDIHCCGSLFPMLYKLGLYEENATLARNVYDWTMDNMWSKRKHYFYFQHHKWFANKASLMRWSQAFMMNALSYYEKSKLGV